MYGSRLAFGWFGDFLVLPDGIGGLPVFWLVWGVAVYGLILWFGILGLVCFGCVGLVD